MSTAPSRGRGRPAKYVVGRNKLPVVGLSQHKDGRYYASHSKPRIYFGKDFDAALAAFRAWEASRGGRVLVPVEVRLAVPGEQVKLAPAPRITPTPGLQPGQTVQRTFKYIDEQAMYDWCRYQLQRDRARFAARIGIPQLAYLDDLTPPEPSLTLAQCWQFYAHRRQRASAEWERNMKLYWGEFTAGVGCKSLRDIGATTIDRFHTKLWDDANKNNRSPTWLRHRLDGVVAVLRIALRQGRDTANVRRVLDLCKRFERPRTVPVDPKPISPDDFRAVLGVCDEKWSAVLLLALNAALYPAEVAAVECRHLDLDAGKLSMIRGKTGFPRVAVLWPRTVEAIRKYLEVEPRRSARLLVTDVGTEYNANHITRNFRRRRVKAGLGDDVTFDRIRDGALTAAIAGGADANAVKLLAGHSAGISDHYVRRNPRMVAGACAAIERHYFG